MEFKGDEAVALRLALPIFETGEWPQVGLMSSVGIHNPPFFIYMLALPMAISMDPVWVTGSLVGLLAVITVLWTYWVVRPRWGMMAAFSAALLFACSPWAVLYARKIWAQDVLPIFCVALLHLLLVVQERRKSWWAAGVPLLLVIMWQVHFSAVALVPIAAVVAIWRWRHIRWTAVLVGLALSAGSLVPYLQYQKENDWPDIEGLRSMASGEKPDGTERPPKPPLNWTAFDHAADITGGTDLSYALCFAHRKDCPSKERWDDRNSGLSGGSMKVADVLGKGLLWGGFVLALWTLFMAIRRRLRREHQSDSPDTGRMGVLLLWFSGVCLFFTFLRLEHTYPHYFIVLYPVAFVLMGIGIARVDNSTVKPRWSRLAARGALFLVVFGHLTTLWQFNGFISKEGGTQGDYGVAYTHKWDAAQWLIQNGLSADNVPYDVRALVDITRSWGDADVIQGTEQVDDALESRYARADVYNTFRAPHMERRPCPAGWRRFGPMIGCPKP